MANYRLKELEQGFVLDGVTLSKQANDEIDRTQPSLNLGVPQYNAVNDPHCKTYFKSKGLPQLVTANVKNTDENNDLQTSMLGKVFDRFVRNSSARQYLQEREDLGAGICTLHIILYTCTVYLCSTHTRVL